MGLYVYEGGQILGVRTPGLSGKGVSFRGATAQLRIPSTSHFGSAHSVLGPGKGKWRGLSPDLSMLGCGASQDPTRTRSLRQQHSD